MKNFLLTLGLCMVALSASAKFGFTEKNFADTISISYNELHQIMVPVTINGKTYQFMFDSGASTCVISSSLADELFVKQISDAKGRGVLDEKKEKNIRQGIMAEMTIGHLHLNGAKSIATDKEQCIFGAYMLYYHGLRYKIDLQKRQLIITDRKELFEPEVASAFELPIKTFGDATSLRFSVSHGGKCAAMFDTGNNSLFLMSQKYFEQFNHGADSVEFRKQVAYTDSADYGDFKGRIFRVENAVMMIDSLRFGSLTFADVPVYTSGSYTGFGCRMLEYGAIIVDGKGFNVYFEPYSHEGGVVRMNEQISPVSIGVKDGHIIVNGVYCKSMEYASGVREGDMIVEINGKPCTTKQEMVKLVGELENASSLTLTIRTSSGANVKSSAAMR